MIRKANLEVEQSDAFVLHRKLKIFEPNLEKAMQNGTMVRLVTPREDHRLLMAWICRANDFRLVTYDKRQIFVFDNKTLNPHMSSKTWLGLGVAWGLWLGHDIWGGKK